MRGDVCVCGSGSSTTFSVLHLLKELVSWILVTILLHLGQVALLWGDGSIHLEGAVREGVIKKGNSKTIISITTYSGDCLV